MFGGVITIRDHHHAKFAVIRVSTLEIVQAIRILDGFAFMSGQLPDSGVKTSFIGFERTVFQEELDEVRLRCIVELLGDNSTDAVPAHEPREAPTDKDGKDTESELGS
jgi:hypothetical protein